MEGFLERLSYVLMFGVVVLGALVLGAGENLTSPGAASGPRLFLALCILTPISLAVEVLRPRSH